MAGFCHDSLLLFRQVHRMCPAATVYSVGLNGDVHAILPHKPKPTRSLSDGVAEFACHQALAEHGMPTDVKYVDLKPRACSETRADMARLFAAEPVLPKSPRVLAEIKRSGVIAKA